MDPANAKRYEVPAPHRCHACTALEVAMSKYADPEQTKAARALRFMARLKLPRAPRP